MGQTLAVAGQRITASLLNRIYGQADTTATTVTAASQTRISSGYTIPANDAQAGTAYRISCWGTGTQGSTVQTLAFRANYAGGGGFNACTIANSFAGVSHPFRWNAEATLVIPSAGTTIKPSLMLRGIIADTNSSPNSFTPFCSEFDDTNGTTLNTTVAWTLQIECAWGATTGAPTITCKGTLFERVN